MTVVKDLCLRAVLLIDGKKVHDGPSREVIGAYLPGGERQAERVWNDPTSAPGSESVRLHAVRIVCENEVAATVDIQKDVRIEIEFWNFQAESDISSSIHLLDKMGVEVLASGNMHSANLAHDEWFGRPHPAGLFQANCVLPGNFLNDGRYSVNVILVTDMTRIECLAKEVVSFVVHDTGEMRKEYKGLWIGVVRPRLAWQTRYVGCLKKETV